MAKKKLKPGEVVDLGGELADVIFTAICIANREGINLDESFKKVLEKLNTRDKDRFSTNK